MSVEKEKEKEKESEALTLLGDPQAICCVVS